MFQKHGFKVGAVSVEQADLTQAAVRRELEAYVAQRPDSTPFHRPAWLRAVEQGTGNRAHMLVARDLGGEIAGLLPLTFMSHPLFGKALVSSGFAVDGGILATAPSVADALAAAAWNLADTLGSPSVELRGGSEPSRDWTLKEGAYVGFSRRLEADDDAQLAIVPKRHRAEIRKGLANDLRLEIGRDARLSQIHYNLYARNVHSLGTPVFPKKLFDSVLDAFGDKADVAVVFQGDMPISAVITLYHGGAAMPYWHGAAAEARKARSNEFLYFKLMGIARTRGLHTFDFGRSKVGTGHAAWKRSWGWEERPLGYCIRVVPGSEARDVNPLSPQYQRKIQLWKKLPLPVANLVGPLLARGLG